MATSRRETDGQSGLRIGGSSPSRLAWMDLMRGVAVLLVVAYHAAFLTVDRGGLGVPGYVEAANSLLAPFRMPVLVMLSGMLLAASLRKGWRPFFEGKLSRIAWPFLVWNLVLALLYWPAPLLAYLRGATYLWFLLFLLLYYAAAWLLQRVPTWLVVVVAFTASVAAPADSKYVERLLYLFALFMLGHLLGGSARGRALLANRWAPAVGVALLGAQYLVIGGTSGYRPTSVLASVGFLLVGAAVARAVSETVVTRPFRFAGEQSLVFYVAHFPVIIVVIEVLERLGVRSGSVTAVTAVLVALVSCTVAALLSVRSRYVGWLFAFPRRRTASVP